MPSCRAAAPASRMSRRIGYLVPEFPGQTHAFFRREIGALIGTARLYDFANRNWLLEEPKGQMIALRVGPQYEKERAKYEEVLKRHERRVERIERLGNAVVEPWATLMRRGMNVWLAGELRWFGENVAKFLAD
jgi:hypothetical protein